MIPAPYTHFYKLSAMPGPKNGLQVDFEITYTDREGLDEEDITGEGFTMTDNFTWAGQLGTAWLPIIDKLATKTKLDAFDEAALDEDDDFLEVTIDTGAGSKQVGTPVDAASFLYPIQELIQAIYEAGGKEKPFELSYLSQQRSGDVEVHVQATFAERTVKLVIVQDRQERRSLLPWPALQTLMSRVFVHDYDPTEGMARPPKRDGHFLHVGGDEWYDIGPLDDVQETLESLLDS